MPELKSKKIDLICIGDRFKEPVLWSAFVRTDNLKEELYFKKRTLFWVGSIYIGHENGDSVNLEVKYADRKFENEAMIEKWDTLSMIAREQKRRFDAEEQRNKNPIPRDIIEALDSRTKYLSSSDLYDFINSLVSTIQDKRLAKNMANLRNKIKVKKK